MPRLLPARMSLICGLAAAAIVAATPRTASAFCGFYVAGADSKLYNNATVVVLMREGNRTVLSMQNNYEGPPEKFAMVVPVPVVLREQDVKTLPREVFERLDRLSAPRLVEYWEQDPCIKGEEGSMGLVGQGFGGGGAGFGGRGTGGEPVKIEAQFAVGEYDIVILSAEDALALERWLGDNGYVIPPGAAPHLQPYVAAGSKFFVAKVDPSKVKFDAQGMATLSPLRMHYESQQFSLPIRLGLINAKGAQDLIVHILADGQRFELANHPNVTLPTEIVVKPEVRGQFPAFYAALFDGLIAKNPGAVVTEYAWSARTCDPCPDDPLDSQELSTLGADVLFGGLDVAPFPGVRQAKPEITGPLHPDIVRRIVRAHINEIRLCYNQALAIDPATKGKFNVDFTVGLDGKVQDAAWVDGPNIAGLDRCVVDAFNRWTFPKSDPPTKIRAPIVLDLQTAAGQRPFVLTRLHARYDASTLGEDLVFRVAPPIANGSSGANGPFVQTPVSAPDNRFQGRYILRNPWSGPITCKAPRRARWGGPPAGAQATVATVTNAAFAPRGALDASRLIEGTIAAATPTTPTTPTPPQPVDVNEPPSPPPVAAPESPAEPTTATPAGCGCRNERPRDAALFVLLLLPLVRRRR